MFDNNDYAQLFIISVDDRCAYRMQNAPEFLDSPSTKFWDSPRRKMGKCKKKGWLAQCTGGETPGAHATEQDARVPRDDHGDEIEQATHEQCVCVAAAPKAVC